MSYKVARNLKRRGFPQHDFGLHYCGYYKGGDLGEWEVSKGELCAFDSYIPTIEQILNWYESK
jgi:hypothetical protein